MTRVCPGMNPVALRPTRPIPPSCQIYTTTTPRTLCLGQRSKKCLCPNTLRGRERGLAMLNSPGLYKATLSLIALSPAYTYSCHDIVQLLLYIVNSPHNCRLLLDCAPFALRGDSPSTRQSHEGDYCKWCTASCTLPNASTSMRPPTYHLR